jgi:hypothetical protein
MTNWGNIYNMSKKKNTVDLLRNGKADSTVTWGWGVLK